MEILKTKKGIWFISSQTEKRFVESDKNNDWWCKKVEGMAHPENHREIFPKWFIERQPFIFNN